jgi:hypothetical protein
MARFLRRARLPSLESLVLSLDPYHYRYACVYQTDRLGITHSLATVYAGSRENINNTMINRRAKGRNRELKSKKLLEKQGYAVEIARQSTRYSKQNDLWGIWDLACIRYDGIRLIQVKSRKLYGKELLPYQAFRCPSNVSKELWIWTDRVKEPEIIYL